MKIVKNLLAEHIDLEYADFQRKLLPNLNAESILGVRTPVLRKIAKQIAKEDYCEEFLSKLPHEYFEENQIHGFILSDIKDFDECIVKLEKFLPYIDNWATTDQTKPKIFNKHKEALVPYIYNWMKSEHTYTVRFAIGMFMDFYLDADYKSEYTKAVSEIKSDEYYVNMEIAWYMATALAKQWDDVIPFIEKKCMDKWVHNKTIQKARESYRITGEQKEYLKGLKQ